MRQRKLPFGFMVQQDKKELHKTRQVMGGGVTVESMQLERKVRPETAKVQSH